MAVTPLPTDTFGRDDPTLPEDSLASSNYSRRTSQERPENQRSSYTSQTPRLQSRGFPTIQAPTLNNPTTILVVLLFLNLVWSMWRTVISAKNVRQELTREVAGIWVVGLGVLIVAEFNPQLALWFMVLITLGNVLFNSAANKTAIKGVSAAFVGSGK